MNKCPMCKQNKDEMEGCICDIVAKPLTPSERAENITQILINCDTTKLDDAVDLILAQIREAEETSFQKGKSQSFEIAINDIKAWAYEKALEEAAKIAENQECGAVYPNEDDCDCMKDIADKIRALKDKK